MCYRHTIDRELVAQACRESLAADDDTAEIDCTPARECAICQRPLDPATADRTGVAHLECARIELDDIYGSEF